MKKNLYSLAVLYLMSAFSNTFSQGTVIISNYNKKNEIGLDMLPTINFFSASSPSWSKWKIIYRRRINAKLFFSASMMYNNSPKSFLFEKYLVKSVPTQTTDSDQYRYNSYFSLIDQYTFSSGIHWNLKEIKECKNNFSPYVGIELGLSIFNGFTESLTAYYKYNKIQHRYLYDSSSSLLTSDMSGSYYSFNTIIKFGVKIYLSHVFSVTPEIGLNLPYFFGTVPYRGSNGARIEAAIRNLPDFFDDHIDFTNIINGISINYSFNRIKKY